MTGLTYNMGLLFNRVTRMMSHIFEESSSHLRLANVPGASFTLKNGSIH